MHHRFKQQTNNITIHMQLIQILEKDFIKDFEHIYIIEMYEKIQGMWRENAKQ